AEAVVETGRRGVPVEHRPFQARQPLVAAALRQAPHQRQPGAGPARLWNHEQVLEVEAVGAFEGGEGVEPEREAHRRAVPLGDVAEGARLFAEQRRRDRRRVHLHLVQQLLVLGEPADEADDQPGVVRPGRAHRDHRDPPYGKPRRASSAVSSALPVKWIASQPRAMAAATFAGESSINRMAAGGRPRPASTAAKASGAGLQARSSLEKNIGSRKPSGGNICTTREGLSLKPPTTARRRRRAASSQSSWLGVSNALVTRSIASTGLTRTPKKAVNSAARSSSVASPRSSRRCRSSAMKARAVAAGQPNRAVSAATRRSRSNGSSTPPRSNSTARIVERVIRRAACRSRARSGSRRAAGAAARRRTRARCR